MGLGSSKTPKVETAVLAATPVAVDRSKNDVTTSTKRRRAASYGIDDTFMRAFSEASSGTAQTLGS